MTTSFQYFNCNKKYTNIKRSWKSSSKKSFNVIDCANVHQSVSISMRLTNINMHNNRKSTYWFRTKQPTKNWNSKHKIENWKSKILIFALKFSKAENCFRNFTFNNSFSDRASLTEHPQSAHANKAKNFCLLHHNEQHRNLFDLASFTKVCLFRHRQTTFDDILRFLFHLNCDFRKLLLETESEPIE